MQKTGNYGLNKPEYNNVADIYPAVCDNMDIIDKTMKEISDAQSDIYLTTNSGNNYSVAIPDLTTLRDGYPVTVKFNAASTGAITINASELGSIPVVDYFNKPVTNVRQYLIANLRYEANSKNFILLGKGGGGDATPDKVLAGYKYTSDTGPGVGNISINGVINKQLGINETFNIPKGYTDGGQITQNISTKESTVITPGTTDIKIPAGTYLKGDLVIKGDSNFTANNIRAGITMFNLTGNYAGTPTTPTSASGSGDYYHSSITLPFKPSSISVSATFGDLTWSKLNGSNSVGGRAITVSGNTFGVSMNSFFDSNVTFTYAAYQ